MPYFGYQGLDIFYRQQGSGPLLLILHGNTASSINHMNELAFFSGLGYHAVAFDFLGCGQSTPVPAPWPLDWWKVNTGIAQTLIEHLGDEQAILCGCSGGAITALWMAILYPEQVKAVIADSLCATYPPGYFTQEAGGRAARTPDQVAFWTSAHGDGWEPVVEADSDLLIRLDAANPEGVDLFGDQLSQIRCPVLFTVSLIDSLLADPGKQAVQMANQVRGSWMFSIHGGDHPMMWSCPTVFQAISREFLQAVSPAGARPI
jgi:valacyclovir hydrolase